MFTHKHRVVTLEAEILYLFGGVRRFVGLGVVRGGLGGLGGLMKG